MILSNVKQKCGPLPPGSAVNLNKLNLIEIELFIKMLYGVWSSLQTDHETNKSPRRMLVSLHIREIYQYCFPRIRAAALIYFFLPMEALI